jgi:hypothetical protein
MIMARHYVTRLLRKRKGLCTPTRSVSEAETRVGRAKSVGAPPSLTLRVSVGTAGKPNHYRK